MNTDISSSSYWDERYKAKETGWDIGHANPALLKLCRQLPKDTRILFPGAGNAYEWRSLIEAGYTEVHVIDISLEPLRELRAAYAEQEQLMIHGDFFNHEGSYDAIIEQTFFCAISPTQRDAYVDHTHELLRPGGLLTGLLFDRIFEHEGPPHGGTVDEYYQRFSRRYAQVDITPCTDSISPRLGSEVVITAHKA